MNELNLDPCPKCKTTSLPFIIESWDDNVMYFYIKCGSCMYRTHSACDIDIAKKEWDNQK